jgi:hypothetical protein
VQEIDEVKRATRNTKDKRIPKEKQKPAHDKLLETEFVSDFVTAIWIFEIKNPTNALQAYHIIIKICVISTIYPKAQRLKQIIK